MFSFLFRFGRTDFRIGGAPHSVISYLKTHQGIKYKLMDSDGFVRVTYLSAAPHRVWIFAQKVLKIWVGLVQKS